MSNFIQRLDRFLFGEDFFISYSRSDGLELAQSLAKALEKSFSVYIDLHGSPISKELPNYIVRRIRRSGVFVLVGTQGATRSIAVSKEVIEFRLTQRPIIPISIGGALDTSALYIQQLNGLALTKEESLSHSATLSEACIDRVIGSFKYLRRNTRLILLSLATLPLVVTFSVASYCVSVERNRLAEEDRISRELAPIYEAYGKANAEFGWVGDAAGPGWGNADPGEKVVRQTELNSHCPHLSKIGFWRTLVLSAI
jgi:hypothetical protein